MIVFLSDNGWMQGEHRIPGDKFLPYEESLRVPLVIRGPGVPKGQTVHGQVSNIDFAPTLVDLANATAGRTMDGVSLVPTIRNPKRLPERAIEIEALEALFGNSAASRSTRWDRPYTGVRTDRYTYVVWTETGEVELYDRKVDPYQLENRAGDPAYAAVERRLAPEADASSRTAAATRATSSHDRRLALGSSSPGSRSRWPSASRAPSVARGDRSPRRPLLRDARARGAIPDASVTVWNTIGLNAARQPSGRRSMPQALAAQRGAEAVILNGPRHFLMDSATATIGRTQTLAGIEMRKVATIPIRTAADLGRAPVHRAHDQAREHLDLGARAARLRAAGARRLELRDAELRPDPRPARSRSADLRALGSRLELPQGWAYRVKRLQRDLTLRAEREGDDRPGRPSRTPTSGCPASSGDSEAPRRGRRGDARGRLARPGDAPRRRDDLRASRSATGPSTSWSRSAPDSSATGTFEIARPRGSAFGTFAMTYVIAGSEINVHRDGDVHAAGRASSAGIKGTV